MSYCIKCKEYKGIETCNRCNEPFCVFCDPEDIEIPLTEPCDHITVKEV